MPIAVEFPKKIIHDQAPQQRWKHTFLLTAWSRKQAEIFSVLMSVTANCIFYEMVHSANRLHVLLSNMSWNIFCITSDFSITANFVYEHGMVTRIDVLTNKCMCAHVHMRIMCAEKEHVTSAAFHSVNKPIFQRWIFGIKSITYTYICNTIMLFA
jgi:hypothetical protein